MANKIEHKRQRSMLCRIGEGCRRGGPVNLLEARDMRRLMLDSIQVPEGGRFRIVVPGEES